MRKLIAGLFYSIDGVAEAPNQFQFDSFDDELGAAMGGIMEEVDTVVMGRVGYSEWAGYWPNAPQDQDFGGFINNVPKFVASKTLSAPLAWNNSNLIEGDFDAFLRDLKSQPGGTISLMAGMTLVRQTLLSGLLDELHLIVHPVISGKGRHLFLPDGPTTRLTLKNGQTTSKGNLILTYAKRAD
jgi:dihydrofolate reductase